MAQHAVGMDLIHIITHTNKSNKTTQKTSNQNTTEQQQNPTSLGHIPRSLVTSLTQSKLRHANGLVGKVALNISRFLSVAETHLDQ